MFRGFETLQQTCPNVYALVRDTLAEWEKAEAGDKALHHKLSAQGGRLGAHKLAEALRYFSRLSVWPEDTLPPEHMDDDNIAEMADPNAFGEYFITYAAIRAARVAIAEWDAGGAAKEEGAQP
jgi:hypothetical protein